MLSRLILAHLLGDFLFQSKKVVQWKNCGLLGHFAHYLIICGCNLLLFCDYLHHLSVILGLIAITLTHIGIDELKITYLKFHPQKDHLGTFLCDQVMHCIIFLTVNHWWSNHRLNHDLPSQMETVLLWLSLGIANTYLMSIFLYYVRKTVEGNNGYRRDYRSMALRSLITTLTLTGGAIWALIMLVALSFGGWRANQPHIVGKIVVTGSALSILITWIVASVSPLL